MSRITDGVRGDNSGRSTLKRAHQPNMMELYDKLPPEVRAAYQAVAWNFVIDKSDAFYDPATAAEHIKRSSAVAWVDFFGAEFGVDYDVMIGRRTPPSRIEQLRAKRAAREKKQAARAARASDAPSKAGGAR